jgi:fructose-1,6-bisphosphatase II
MTTPSLTTRGPLAALEPLALAATRSAAIACQPWVGAANPKAADAAATAAMRQALAAGSAYGTVVIGEGTKDDAPMLFEGEVLGAASGQPYDIAVDPLEGTQLCAGGLDGALATIAFAESGTLATLSASFYMDKLVGPPELSGVLAITAEPEVNLKLAGDALGRAVSTLRVVVLDKPRHAELIARLRTAGAQVLTPSDGDIAGALAALLPDGEADLLMGIGGTPEGVMTACAARALGGFMKARLAPLREDERAAMAEAGLDTERVYDRDELAGGEALFVATGVTDGTLLRRPWQQDNRSYTDSIVISAGNVSRIQEAQA